MPGPYTYPGVYIEEVPSGVRTISGVSTSTTAFIGYFTRGPMDKAVQIFNWGDFEREFGGLRRDSEAGYAIQQFFLNGGSEAWVVRTAKGPKKAAVDLLDKAGGAPVLTVTASSEGKWGDNVRLEVDYGTEKPDKTFNLVVTEVDATDGQTSVVRSETFRNLSIDKTDPAYVVDVVNAGSKLVKLALVSNSKPAQTGTVSTDIASLDFTTINADTIDVFLNGAATALGSVTLARVPATHEQLRAALQSGLRKLTELSRATVELVGAKSTQLYLRVKSGTGNPGHVLTFKDNGGTLAAALRLDSAERSNVQQYVVGGKASAAQGYASGGTAEQQGDDGSAPTATELRGSPSAKTGLYALEDVDIFNILCIPYTMKLGSSDAQAVITEAQTYCQERRAFYVVDYPVSSDQACDEPVEIKEWLSNNATLRDRNAALYYPRVKIADPLNKYRLRTVGASGTIAGLYARTDGERGVWKAPAGTDATLRNVQGLEYTLTDQENGTLNPLGINCLRNFPVYGNICWGARTLRGADQLADEYKYVPVRRLVLFLEESLYRGTKWVVFEPNDEPLWAQIRLNVGAFMHNLFRQGAFQGTAPKDAYFVKCDGETTGQSDINLGIVNILVAFAPLKPAEFVIIKIQQMAGQVEA